MRLFPLFKVRAFPKSSYFSDTMAKATRWGILGAGLISTDFCLALKTLNPEEHCIKAVAARSLERAKKFADTFEIERSYGSYAELLRDPEIDIAYVGTIHTTHKELTILALQNGKHVLCEKPAALNLEDLEEMIAAAKKSDRLFMEAVWTRCTPFYQEISKIIQDGTIGSVRAVQVSFGVEVIGSVERIMNPEVGGGVLNDLGAYTMTFADFAFMGEKPLKISAVGFKADSGVDLNGSITLLYSGRRIAQTWVSGNANLPNEGIIIGSKGKIVVKFPFWCPTQIEVNGEIRECSLPETPFPTNFVNSAGLRYEADHMRNLILEKKTESDLMPHETSRRILKMLKEARDQLDSTAL